MGCHAAHSHPAAIRVLALQATGLRRSASQATGKQFSGRDDVCSAIRPLGNCSCSSRFVAVGAATLGLRRSRRRRPRRPARPDRSRTPRRRSREAEPPPRRKSSAATAGATSASWRAITPAQQQVTSRPEHASGAVEEAVLSISPPSWSTQNQSPRARHQARFRDFRDLLQDAQFGSARLRGLQLREPQPDRSGRVTSRPAGGLQAASPPTSRSI